MLTGGTYNVKWVIYTISGNIYQLFPLRNLTGHVMNSTDINGNSYNYGGYTKSEMYGFIHNTVLPNLKRSGLNITACDLVSKSVYGDICSKIGMTSYDLVGHDNFWLTDIPDNNYNFCYVDYGGNTSWSRPDLGYGVRPLITVVR